MEGYTLLGIKLAMGIIGLVLQINLMGKGNLAPTSAMDQVQNYVLGGIIGGVIYSDSIGVLQFSLVLVLWTLLIFTLRFIKNHNQFVKSIIDGKPVWVILNGKVQTAECMRNGISAHDLMFKLRAAGVYEIATVKRAVLEQNGQLSIIQYGDESLRYPLIVDGQLDSDVLDIINKDEEWVKAQLEEQKLELNKVYIGEYLNGKLITHLYEKA
jgi:raw score 11.87